MRGWALDIHPPQPRIQTQTPARFRKAIDAYRPDHPREENRESVLMLDFCKQLTTVPVSIEYEREE
jgi:hypothetical protein